MASVFIYQSALDFIKKEISRVEDKENGGLLYGYKTRKKEIVIILATPPGENAHHKRYHLQLDHEYLRSVDRIVKDNVLLDHVGDWHSHLCNLNKPSRSDVSNTHTISRKNNYHYYVQLIAMIGNNNEHDTFCLNPFIYNDPIHGFPQLCLLNVLPGRSPIQLSLEESSQFFKPTSDRSNSSKHKNTIEKQQFSNAVVEKQPVAFAKTNQLDKRIENQLLQLPDEVLENVEVDIGQEGVIATIPIPGTGHYLHIAYSSDKAGAIDSVYLSKKGGNQSPIEVTERVLEFGPFMHIKTIWSRFSRFFQGSVRRGVS